MAAQLQFGTGNSVGFGTTGSAGSGTATFSKSALSNMVVGDLLVAFIHNQASTAGATMSGPSGWIRYGAAVGNVTMNASRLSGVYYYPLKSQADIDAIPASITWNFSDSAARVGCIVARAIGIDLDNIEDAASTSFPAGVSGTSMTIPTITTNSAATLLVGVAYHQNSANTTSPTVTSFMTAFQTYKTSPTGSTLGNTGSVLGYNYLTSSGSTGAQTMTVDSSSNAMSGELVAFKAGAWTPSYPPIIRPYTVGTPTMATHSSPVTSFTIAIPNGLRDGDVLIMALSGQSATATSDYAASGWTRISQAFESSSTSNRIIALYAYPVPVATDVSQTSVTFSSTDSATGGRIAAEMTIVRGADLSHLVSSGSTFGTMSGQTTTVQPGAPTVANNLLLVAYGANYTANIDHTIASGPSGMTQQAFVVSSLTAGNSKTTLAVYKQDVDSGAIATKTLSYAGAQAQSSGVAVTLRGASTAPTNLGIATSYTSATDTLSAGSLFYTSATHTLSTPAEVRPMPKGYDSVTAMLASTPFYIAHRGGSINWPEMSLHAYTQSAFWGVGALELSLARTSDGVWFGLHDATLDRTSGTSGFTASAHTWAEVQNYLITATGTSNSSQGAKPYMRWEEMMATYYKTHILFIDPKVASAYTTELLNMMDAQPNNPTTRFVGKYYGVSGNASNTSGWARSLSDRGYKSWGYFYQADAANFANYQGRWDILGMDYNADQTTWNSILSYGKPVIGHIVPSSVAATTAFNYGASGLMVSGVQQVIPRRP